MHFFIYTNCCLVYFLAFLSFNPIIVRVLQVLQSIIHGIRLLVLIISLSPSMITFSRLNTLALFLCPFLFLWSYYGFILCPSECTFHYLPLNGCYRCQNRSANDCFPQGRYEIMRNYMPKVGSMGLDMMFRTCTVQVGTDFFP